jgi:hypothetical protein
MSLSKGLRLVIVAALGGAALGVAVASLRSGSSEGRAPLPSTAAPGAGAVALADPPRPAFEVPTPTRLRASAFESTWAPVRRAVTARSRPGSGFPAVARVGPRTPEGTSNLVLVLGREQSDDEALWVRARLPVLPNNTTGWVPRSALGGYAVVRTHLLVDLGRRRATLLRNGRAVFTTDVGVGTAAFPTPTGRFYVRNKLTRYRNAFYGPVAFGTSARSAVLTDWPAGGFVGIHGTNRPELIPGRVSHGCIRLRNEAILRLAALMPVGTPLTIRA